METLTKEQILHNEISHVDEALINLHPRMKQNILDAMQEYASQMTADRDKRILELELELSNEKRRVECFKADLERDKWLSVEEGLPPYNEVVLGFGKDDGMSVQDFSSVTKSGFKMFHKTNKKIEITHWQPLPDKPKDK